MLPRPPARVLEVGCGEGELARVLATAGYEVTAVDPQAPAGRIFRRVPIEDFDSPEAFDAGVAQISLHHVDDLGRAVERIAALLVAGATMVVDEFAPERLVGETARWYYEQRRRDESLESEFEEWLAGWQAEHLGMHGYAAVRAALDPYFTERFFGWVPYLYRYRLGDDVEPLERRLVEEGAIKPVGYRYVGERRA